MSDGVLIALIVAGSGTVNASLAAVAVYFAHRGDARGEKNAQSLDRTERAIGTLEKNTNSIKDELVKVTGEKSFNDGLTQAAEATARGLDPPERR